MKKIGITGGIGSGKSTVCRIFRILGIPAYSADERAKVLISSDRQLREKIMEEFGQSSYTEQGYNKSYIASLVFRDKIKLEKLNALIHPRVFSDFRNWISEQQETPYILYESAILIENRLQNPLDQIIAVNAPINLRIERIIKRDKSLRSDIQDRINNQLSTEKMMAVADWIIENGNSQLILPQILSIHLDLLG